MYVGLLRTASLQRPGGAPAGSGVVVLVMVFVSNAVVSGRQGGPKSNKRRPLTLGITSRLVRGPVKPGQTERLQLAIGSIPPAHVRLDSRHSHVVIVPFHDHLVAAVGVEVVVKLLLVRGIPIAEVVGVAAVLVIRVYLVLGVVGSVVVLSCGRILLVSLATVR